MNPFFRGEVEDTEWRFLLTGGVALENPFPNPASDWLSDKSWAEVVRVSQLEAFDDFMMNFSNNVSVMMISCIYDSKFLILSVLQSYKTKS